MSLRKIVLSTGLSHYSVDNDRTHHLLAHLIPLRYLLPSLAHLVQLDIVHSYHGLSCYVCLLQCIRYIA